MSYCLAKIKMSEVCLYDGLENREWGMMEVKTDKLFYKSGNGRWEKIPKQPTWGPALMGKVGPFPYLRTLDNTWRRNHEVHFMDTQVILRGLRRW